MSGSDAQPLRGGTDYCPYGHRYFVLLGDRPGVQRLVHQAAQTDIGGERADLLACHS